jgi:hypothetical protein
MPVVKDTRKEEKGGPGGTSLEVKLLTLMQRLDERQVMMQKQLEGIKREVSIGERRFDGPGGTSLDVKLMKSMQCLEVRQVQLHKQVEGMMRDISKREELVVDNVMALSKEVTRLGQLGFQTSEGSVKCEAEDMIKAKIEALEKGLRAEIKIIQENIRMCARFEGYPSDQDEWEKGSRDEMKTIQEHAKRGVRLGGYPSCQECDEEGVPRKKTEALNKHSKDEQNNTQEHVESSPRPEGYPPGRAGLQENGSEGSAGCEDGRIAGRNRQRENTVFVGGFPRDSPRASIEEALKSISESYKEAVSAVWSPGKRWSNGRIQFKDSSSMWEFLSSWKQQENKQVSLDGRLCDIWCFKEKNPTERARDGETCRVLRILKEYINDLDAKDWEIMFLRRAIWADGFKIAEFNKQTSEWDLMNLCKFNVKGKQAEIAAKIAAE